MEDCLYCNKKTIDGQPFHRECNERFLFRQMTEWEDIKATHNMDKMEHEVRSQEAK